MRKALAIQIELARPQFVTRRAGTVQDADCRSTIGILCLWYSKFYGRTFPPCFGHTGMAS